MKPRRLSWNKTLSIILAIVIVLVLIAPQAIRYTTNMYKAHAELQDEKAYIQKEAKQTLTAAEAIPVLPQFDLNTNGEMKVVISSEAMRQTNNKALEWVANSAKVWNKALGHEVIKVSKNTVDQSDNQDVNVWPADAKYQLMVGYRKSLGGDGILAITTMGGNSMWLGEEACSVWLSKIIQSEDYKSGRIIGPVALGKIEDLHDAEAEHTITHELGHAFGLKHQGTALDLMSPMVGINDDGQPTKTEVDQVKTIRYLAMHPAVFGEGTFADVFTQLYAKVNDGATIPKKLTVINDGGEE
ncbi:MAG: matrixin family metalloprotease [Lactobacillaceae bacterium]|jgi:hypothetical protein|nr:matrixin family metalloprotease [Lactobacillaceae bacterium]